MKMRTCFLFTAIFMVLLAVSISAGIHAQAKPTMSNVYNVVIDYSKSLTRMIGNGGYDYSDPCIIAKNFPIDGEGRVEVTLELVHLNYFASSREVLAELDSRGLRPANIEELLAFGSKYPNKQNKFPIVALGDIWIHAGGFRSVPCLGGDAPERRLGLVWFDADWGSWYRFLVRRK